MSLYKVSIIFFYIFCFVNYSLSCQISKGGLPKSLNNNITNECYVADFQALNVKDLLKEDSIENSTGLYPFRFGVDLDTDININKCGTWDSLKDGRIWRIELNADEATSINLIFKDFYLPETSELFLYTPDYKYIIGAFSSENNNYDGVFATTVLPGSRTILEYYEPYNINSRVNFTINKLIYGYKNIFFPEVKGYGGSGFCNININCPEGQEWQNEKRAVAMIMLKNNSRICTGVLLNNSKQDATPYLLTANHCLGGESTWIFMFNYESPDCSNINGPLNYTIQGSKLRATDTPSDFSLVEINSIPPLYYNVYYAGWSAVNQIYDSCTAIHHPSGDIKKISFDYNAVTSTAWGSGVSNSHWTVSNWEAGTTESGSSGSPLFNRNKKIIGQLHGGSASCNSISDDNYGKISYSWDTKLSHSQQLKYWLDPNNSGIKELNGFDFNIPLYNSDVSLDEVLIPSSENICNNNFSPAIKFSNKGEDTLKNLLINYSLDGILNYSFIWQGSIPYMSSSSIVFPEINFQNGLRHLKFFISEVNGNTDDNQLNDTIEVFFNIIQGNNIQLIFHSDAYPLENNWEIRDSLNNIVAISPPLIPNNTYKHNLCLKNGCYDFYIYDIQGDGMMGSITNSDTGYVYISTYNDTIVFVGGNFGNSKHVNFCIYNTEIIEHDLKNIASCIVYPNPSKNNFIIDSKNNFSGNANYKLFNTSGTLINTGSLLFSSGKALLKEYNLFPGVYFCKIIFKTEIVTLKIMVL